jgi:hypothetical protein
MLFLNQSLLVLLQSLELHLFLCNQLDRELTGLLNDDLIGILLPLACSGPLHDTIEHDRALINVISLQKLLTDPHLAPNDGMHIELHDFPYN